MRFGRLGKSGLRGTVPQSIAAETLARAGLEAVDGLDSRSALVLAEHLSLPLFTASDEVDSDRVGIHRPW